MKNTNKFMTDERALEIAKEFLNHLGTPQILAELIKEAFLDGCSWTANNIMTDGL